MDIIQNDYPDVYRSVSNFSNYIYIYIYRFVVPVFPSSDDDVITSPYNWYCTCTFNDSYNVYFSVLALSELTSKADCVLPIENQVHNNKIMIDTIILILGSL